MVRPPQPASVFVMVQSTMETRSQVSRLDQHDEQISKIQSDILEIKAAMDSERVESAEFRKVVLGWVKQQGKLPFRFQATLLV